MTIQDILNDLNWTLVNETDEHLWLFKDITGFPDKRALGHTIQKPVTPSDLFRILVRHEAYAREEWDDGRWTMDREGRTMVLSDGDTGLHCTIN